MFNLKIPCLVEEDAIATALRQHAQVRMLGPEFNMGDLVRFQHLHPTNLGPIIDQLGCVAEVLTDSPGYRVWFVNEHGDIHAWKVKPHQIRPAEAA
jgi:hypothetical protein